MSSKGRGFAVLFALLALALASAAGAGAGNGNAYGRDGVKPTPPDVKFAASKAKKKQLVQQAVALGAAEAAAGPSKTPPLGTVRPFVAINFNTGGPFLTNATLRGVGKNIEVWVQNNRSFPSGDCRNANA